MSEWPRCWLGPYWVKKGGNSAGARQTYTIVTKSGHVVVANLISKRVAEQMCETMNQTGATVEPVSHDPE